MSTVTIPDDFAALLRTVEEDDRTDLNELVVRALAKYMCLCKKRLLSKEDTEDLIRRAEEREGEIARAGITEQELADHFEQWRRRQRTDG